MSDIPLGWRARGLLACVVLPPLLEVLSFASVAALAERPGLWPHGNPPADQDLADFVARHLRAWPAPWRYTCLRRGIVLFHLLRAAGRPVTLQIGVRKNGGKLQAHAWLVLDGRPYLEHDAPEHASFSVIATFPEAAAS